MATLQGAPCCSDCGRSEPGMGEELSLQPNSVHASHFGHNCSSNSVIDETEKDSANSRQLCSSDASQFIQSVFPQAPTGQGLNDFVLHDLALRMQGVAGVIHKSSFGHLILYPTTSYLFLMKERAV